jgi:hypothetical protein
MAAMPTVETELRIAAPPTAVWRTLLDRGRWRQYSDFFSLDPARPLAEGQAFWFGLRLGGLLPTPIRVQVLRRVEAQELRWVGQLPGFRGEHYFRLHAAPAAEIPAEPPAGIAGPAPTPDPVTATRSTAASTHWVHGEHFSGPLGELLFRLAGQVIRQTYAAFNAGLAMHVERRRETARSH